MPDNTKEPGLRHVVASDVVRLTFHEHAHVDVKHGLTNLRRARSFLRRVIAEQERDPFDRQESEDFLTAAIVFGKAVQDWMADEFGGEHKGDKKRWLKQVRLWGDTLPKFFADLRDVIVHDDGSVDVTTRTNATMHALPAVMVLSGNPVIASLTPTNPTPEEQQASEEQRHRDEERAALLRREDEERVKRIFAEHRAEQERQARAHVGAGHQTVLHFNHPDSAVSSHPAVDVVGQYLDLLERVLSEIEQMDQLAADE